MLERFFAAQPVRVYLFGSAATGQLRRGSDLDVAVLPLGALPPGWQSELRERLEESNLLYRVDLIDLSQVSPEFARRVAAEGVRWIG
jgi:predicted nucleotidyltransferase